MNARSKESQKSVTKTFSWPVFDESDVNAVTDVARSGAWGNPDCSGLVEKFEREFADFCGSKYAVTCANGSVSLRLALIAAGVRPGDEVIVPPYTFIATASVVIECNCVPVFVDIDPNTYNIDPDRIAEAITPRTKAIIPVHFAGLACDMDRIMAIAAKHNLTVIEDAAHAHGGIYKGKKLGTIGHAGSFSFQSSKNLNSGEGGIVVTNDEKLYDRINSLRNVGRVKGGMWYEHHLLGCNYRITQFQAALLSNQLKRLESQTATRDSNGRYLNELLRNVKGITPMTIPAEATRHTFHLFMFRYDQSQFKGISKRDFVARLIEEGVPASGGYPYPLYKQTVFQEKNFMCYAIPEEVDYTKVFCEVAERACATEAIWILQHAMLGSRDDMDSFARAIVKIQRDE
ncbi:MAG: DegT/DnrJ/EryC1/StrS family aminotransferase [Chryseolinea sp.]